MKRPYANEFNWRGIFCAAEAINKTLSGIIGSKEFVAEVFDGVKHLLNSKDERRFTPVGGMDGVYSMKRLGVGR